MPKLFEDPGVDEFGGLNLRDLRIDEAWMVITSNLPSPSWLYVLSDDCDQVRQFWQFNLYTLLGNIIHF